MKFHYTPKAVNTIEMQDLKFNAPPKHLTPVLGILKGNQTLKTIETTNLKTKLSFSESPHGCLQIKALWWSHLESVSGLVSYKILWSKDNQPPQNFVSRFLYD